MPDPWAQRPRRVEPPPAVDIIAEALAELSKDTGADRGAKMAGFTFDWRMPGADPPMCHRARLGESQAPDELPTTAPTTTPPRTASPAD